MSWPLKSISEVATVNPRMPKDKELPDEVVFLPMAAISERGEVLEQNLRPLEEVRKGFTYFERGDVLLAKITPCFENGKAAFLEHLQSDVGFGSTEFHVVRPNTEVLDGKYLFYMLWNGKLRHDGELNMTGSAGQRRVPAGFLERYRIPLPLLDTQRHIAKVLEQADRLCRQAQQMEAEFDRLAQALFLEMFGDYRQQTTEHFLPLAGVADVVSGVAKGSKLSGAVRTLPYLRVANVQDGFLDLSEIKEIEASERDIEKYRLKAGDILMTEGGDFDKLGRGAMWSGEIAECIHQNHIFRVRLSDAYEPRFFACYLRTPMVKAYFLGCAKKTTNLASINMSQLKALPTPKEPLDRQKQFVAALQQIEAQRQMARRQQAELEQAFQSLMQRAIKGELAPKLA